MFATSARGMCPEADLVNRFASPRVLDADRFNAAPAFLAACSYEASIYGSNAPVLKSWGPRFACARARSGNAADCARPKDQIPCLPWKQPFSSKSWRRQSSRPRAETATSSMKHALLPRPGLLPARWELHRPPAPGRGTMIPAAKSVDGARSATAEVLRVTDFRGAWVRLAPDTEAQARA